MYLYIYTLPPMPFRSIPFERLHSEAAVERNYDKKQ